MNTTLVKIQKIKDVNIERIDAPYVYPRSTENTTKHKPEKYNPVKVKDSAGKQIYLHVNIDESLKKIPALDVFVKNLLKGYNEEINQKARDIKKKMKQLRTENKKLQKQVYDLKGMKFIDKLRFLFLNKIS